MGNNLQMFREKSECVLQYFVKLLEIHFSDLKRIKSYELNLVMCDLLMCRILGPHLPVFT